MKNNIWILAVLVVIAVALISFNYNNENLENESLNNAGNIVIDDSIKTEAKELSGDLLKEFKKQDIFEEYYSLADNVLAKMSLEEKISQILLVRFPNSNAVEDLKKYQFGGYIFFEKDFKGKTEEEVKNMINSLQSVSKIPILTAVDEEGGIVVRVSSNKNLANEEFKSSSELYNLGGLELIKQDTIEKSRVLYNLGINLNLAPVVDISTNLSDYIYRRTLGEDAELTAEYASTVIESSKNTGVSYTLKHFPGYGNNEDTHIKGTVDNRDFDDIWEGDLKPFKAGIDSGAEAIMVSHNTVSSLDKDNPASLSKSIHDLLRDELEFSGVIITDDLAMGAVSSIGDATAKAVLAGNDLIITSDYEESISSIKKAIDGDVISEEILNNLVRRIIAWKYYKGLIKCPTGTPLVGHF